MAFDAKPQSWLGAAARADTGISIPVTAVSTTLFEAPGEALAQFLKADDPIYFDNSFNTIVANVVQYVRTVSIVAGNTRFGLASAPSWDSPTNRSWTNGISKNVLVPSRVWFTIQNSGIAGVPAGLPTLTPTQANRTTGDIRYFFLELPKMLKRIWDAKGVTERPVRVRTESHDFIAGPSMSTRNYAFELDLVYTTTSIVSEP